MRLNLSEAQPRAGALCPGLSRRCNRRPVKEERVSVRAQRPRTDRFAGEELHNYNVQVYYELSQRKSTSMGVHLGG